ncbi:sigma-70 family RNA polymerase sigma factor [uncultured Gemmiger sp.]|uniref:sigma-70 family RNA polymerase sigma factor n=1 Tax=uncultured Gemmiger sp. TaxID=1623490 RepID=UPI0025FBAB44|nr:sigma-70 family RNA polymerase sigma factor [uncultured Gemmiger sp.]
MEEENLALWIVNDPETGLKTAMARYAPAVKGILSRILPGRPEDVEECMADVFVALWKQADHLCRTGTPVKAWLVVTARNTGISRWRKLRRKNELPLNEEVGDTLALLDALPSDAEDLVGTLVAAMSQSDREIFLRKYYLLQPTRQIARALNMSESTVNTRLSRGRERLRRELERKGVRAHA